MKRKIWGLTIVAILIISTLMIGAAPALAAGPDKVATIQGGTITDTAGDPITVGYDRWGYNYQAHIFSGIYSNYDRVQGGEFSNINLQMKWNDAWLANTDADGNGKLDRHYGFNSYIGSGAWLTNHDTGISEDGKTWTYFIKIIAVSANATKSGGIWYAVDGTVIGPDIWGQFAVIQQVVTGSPPSAFITADEWPFPGNYRSPSGSGLGKW